MVRVASSYWNTTSLEEADSFDYYAGSSQPLELLTTLSVLRGKVVEGQNATADICEPSWNYTVTIDFVAPGVLSACGRHGFPKAPSLNYSLPSDTERYKTVLAYHSLGLQLRSFVNWSILEPFAINASRISQTKLLDMRSYLAASDLQKAIPELYEDMLSSLP